MVTAEIITITLVIVILVVCGIMVIRNEAVYSYRMRVIHKIHDDNVKLLWSGEPLQNLDKIMLNWEILDKVSYNSMVIRFWRPCESFFPPEYRV